MKRSFDCYNISVIVILFYLFFIFRGLSRYGSLRPPRSPLQIFSSYSPLISWNCVLSSYIEPLKRPRKIVRPQPQFLPSRPWLQYNIYLTVLFTRNDRSELPPIVVGHDSSGPCTSAASYPTSWSPCTAPAAVAVSSYAFLRYPLTAIFFFNIFRLL